jgi:choloylglycine hydrolase
MIFILISLLFVQSILAESLIARDFATSVTSSCTIFTATIGDTVLFGNNEDYKLNNAYRWYVPAQNVSTDYFGDKEIYGAVFFGFDNNDYPEVDTWEQGGMNEYGLCYDANGLPDIQLNLDSLASYPYTSHALAQVLWDCRDVEDVIVWFQNHKWEGQLGGQFHYADATGDAVVVGVNTTGQWVFTRKDSSYLVSTNFNVNDTSHGSYPCSRYNTASQMLEDISIEEDLNVSACASILQAVHQEGTYATKYSNICDPVNLEFYFITNQEFTSITKYNLTEELSNTGSFEQKSSFMGVTGVHGGNILVKTEQIDIIFPTNTNTSETSGIVFSFSIIGLSLYVLVHRLFKKRKSKSNLK